MGWILIGCSEERAGWIHLHILFLRPSHSHDDMIVRFTFDLSLAVNTKVSSLNRVLYSVCDCLWQSLVNLITGVCFPLSLKLCMLAYLPVGESHIIKTFWLDSFWKRYCLFWLVFHSDSLFMQLLLHLRRKLFKTLHAGRIAYWVTSIVFFLRILQNGGKRIIFGIH